MRAYRSPFGIRLRHDPVLLRRSDGFLRRSNVTMLAAVPCIIAFIIVMIVALSSAWSSARHRLIPKFLPSLTFGSLCRTPIGARPALIETIIIARYESQTQIAWEPCSRGARTEISTTLCDSLTQGAWYNLCWRRGIGKSQSTRGIVRNLKTI
jgi:hypothetical protein